MSLISANLKFNDKFPYRCSLSKSAKSNEISHCCAIYKIHTENYVIETVHIEKQSIHHLSCTHKLVHTFHTSVGRSGPPWKYPLHRWDTLVATFEPFPCHPPCSTWGLPTWPSFVCALSFSVSCNSSFFFSYHRPSDAAQGGVSTLSGCYSQREFVRPRAASRQKWGAADQEESLYKGTYYNESTVGTDASVRGEGAKTWS